MPFRSFSQVAPGAHAPWRMKSAVFWLTLVVLLAAAFVVHETGRANRQALAIRNLKSLGAHFTYNYQHGWLGQFEFESKPYAPAWLRRLTHEHFLTHVHEANLMRARLGPGDMAQFQELASLESLSLEGSLVDDDGLRHVAKLSKLQFLGLSQSRVTSAGMRHLEGLNYLETLLLTRTDVGDAGLESLAHLTNLSDLRLGSTPITDAGLAHLQSLSGLRCLILHNTRITDAAVARLARMQSLECLTITGTDISPQGVRRLRRALPRCTINC